MNPEEYENLERVEKIHWYYAGKREIARHWMMKCGQLTSSSRVADCGAGTGAFAEELSTLCRVVAVDDHPESLDQLRLRHGIEEVLSGSCTALPLETNSCDFVTALDVLEHIEDDALAFQELVRVAEPGGLVIITVPALMSLWSDWDVSLRHFRRYDRRSLQALLGQASVEVLYLNYMNFFAFPAVWTLRKLRGGSSSMAERAEDQIPARIVNDLLRKLFVWSSCQTWIRWPVGVGLLAVLRKRT